jgi:hypothetical protein
MRRLALNEQIVIFRIRHGHVTNKLSFWMCAEKLALSVTLRALAVADKTNE